MFKKMTNEIYLSFHNKFFDKIIKKKRLEILQIIKEELKGIHCSDCLDIGTTHDVKNESSNFIVKNLKLTLNYKAFSNFSIKDNFFSSSTVGSISNDFEDENLNFLKSDIVLSSATIEHVGSNFNQKKDDPKCCLVNQQNFFYYHS